MQYPANIIPSIDLFEPVVIVLRQLKSSFPSSYDQDICQCTFKFKTHVEHSQQQDGLEGRNYFLGSCFINPGYVTRDLRMWKEN